MQAWDFYNCLAVKSSTSILLAYSVSHGIFPVSLSLSFGGYDAPEGETLRETQSGFSLMGSGVGVGGTLLCIS